MAVAITFPSEDAEMYPSMEKGKLLEALSALRKVFLVTQKAFEVADILGQPDERREGMRALHNEAIALTNDLDNVEDLEAVRVKLDVLLIRMASTADANSGRPSGFRQGGPSVTNDPQPFWEGAKPTHLGHEDRDGNFHPAKAATAPLLSDGEMRPPEAFGSGLMALSYWQQGAIHARLFYENLIASGELMVVKTTRNTGKWDYGFECVVCERRDYRDCAPAVGEFCKCGAKIVEG